MNEPTSTDMHTKIAVAIIVRKGPTILMGLRLGKAGSGTWGLPGGHLEFNESIQAAAKRELLEETGLVAELQLVNITNDTRGIQHYIHFTFEASKVVGEPTVTEPHACQRWEWFNVKELPADIFFGQAKVLEAVLSNKFFLD